MKYNIVLGSSGLVGKAFYEYLGKNKKFIFFNRSGPKFRKFDLEREISKFPFKEVDKCFFFASPRIKKKNFKNKNFKKEYLWLKKIIRNIKIKKIIYLSSSSVYYQKNHIIGSTKLNCEKLILKNKKIFKNYQIWRPFNLIGNRYVSSDHFHNYLFKIMFLEKKKSHSFFGSSEDKRGYSHVNHFVRILHKYSNSSKNFVKNYGNKNLVKVSEIYDLFNKHYKKINGSDFKISFKSKKANENSVKLKKNCVYFNKKSLVLLRKYLKNSTYEKKM